MKERILALLRERKEYISGQELCEEFQVSRTAIWKVMNQLKKEGYEIEAIQNRGYKLFSEPDLLKKEEFQKSLKTNYVGQNCTFLSTIDSTNLEIKRRAEEGLDHGSIVVADEQTKGVGRRGRSWESKGGKNLYFSLLLRPQFLPIKASMLTLIMAYAVAEALEELGIFKVKIKWPNDLVLNGKKICGILTEMSAEIDSIHYVVIGTGINLCETSFSDEIKDTASSVYLESGISLRRGEVLSRICGTFEKAYEEFLQKEDLGFLKEAYENRLVNKDREVKVLDPKGEYQGLAKGINEQGELLVEDEVGKEHLVYAGEVSVRGIYGYV